MGCEPPVPIVTNGSQPRDVNSRGAGALNPQPNVNSLWSMSQVYLWLIYGFRVRVVNTQKETATLESLVDALFEIQTCAQYAVEPAPIFSSCFGQSFEGAMAASSKVF